MRRWGLVVGVILLAGAAAMSVWRLAQFTASIETELDAEKTVTAAGDGGQEQRERHPDHMPHDVVVDPESREVINRENDVRAHAEEREHPDQALLRYRAYQPARSESDNTAPIEPHANIKA